MKHISGWVFTSVGLVLALVFGAYTLFYLGRGPYGILIAIYFTGPLFLLGVALAIFGSYLRKNASQRNSSPSAVRNGVRIMTNQTPEQPKRNGYNPITLGDVQPNSPDPFFASLDTPGSRIVGAALFLLLFTMSTNTTVAAPLMLLVLLACLLFRMGPRERGLTAVPLTFSAVRLGFHMAGPLGIWSYAIGGTGSSPALRWDVGATWLPLFLAAYLFFTSTIESNTGRVVFWYSVATLLSGLIPGSGYVVIFAMLYYSLFFAILVSIIMDLSAYASAARPLSMPQEPIRVHV